MNYAIGIEITQHAAAVAIVDPNGGITMLQEDAQNPCIPCVSLITNTGDVLVGQRAVRYGILNGIPVQRAEPSALFAHIAQLLRRNLQVQTLPPVVLSVRSLDIELQLSLAQAAYDGGLDVLRCINSLAAYAMDLAAADPSAEGRLTAALHDGFTEGAYLQALIDYSDGVWEILSCTSGTERPNRTPYFDSEAGRQKAMLAAARGAALLAGELTGLKSLTGVLLMDIISADVTLYKNDGTALTLVQRDTAIPVRVDHILLRQEIMNADGRLTFGFDANYCVCVSLTHPVLRMCEKLKLVVNIDAKRKTTLTVADAENDFCSQTFTLLQLTQGAPAATEPSAVSEEDMLSAMLEAMDGLENGLRMLSDAERESSVGKGMLQIHKQFAAALKKLGVEPVPAQGCLFDPQVHEAVVAMPHEHSGWVLQEYRRGYLQNGTLLRAAQVMVSE